MKKQNNLANDFESLYLEFLRAFYEEENHEATQEIGKRLEVILASQPDLADSIRGDEIRSLLSESSGDLTTAIQFRESEIRKIFELHLLVQGKPAWEYVRQQYDHSDIGDRLDLLANLYAETGNFKRAIDILNESKSFCISHQISFDGEELLEEFVIQDRLPAVDRESRMVDHRDLDQAIIDAYKTINVSVENILIDDQKSRMFYEEVSRRLPEGMEVSAISAKKRLVNLRRRGQDRGGLPRLSRRA